MLIKPKARFKRITEITPKFLENREISGLILDLDNTLTLHDAPIAEYGVTDWLDTMRESNIKMMIVSNNNYDRVLPTARKLDLPFVANGKKPITTGFTKAKNKMNLNKKQIAVIGDQIFTDMICGNLSGMFTILVEPFKEEQHGFLHFKRIIQKRLFPERKIKKYDI